MKIVVMLKSFEIVDVHNVGSFDEFECLNRFSEAQELEQRFSKTWNLLNKFNECHDYLWIEFDTEIGMVKLNQITMIRLRSPDRILD